ncbi:MAG TPA: glycosyltransferase family 39 protein [Phycisphaerae bacterium]|nr:glycosyltransferase family 39 protein [Phycisphaerae bacterium]
MPTETAGQLNPPGTPPRRVRLRPLVCLLVLVGMTRAVVLTRTETIARDGAVFLHMARELTGGEEVRDPLRAFRQHPGYPAAVGAVARATGAQWPDGWALTGQILSVVASLAAVAAVCLIGADFFGPGVGLIGALVFGLSPRFTQISCDATAEATSLAAGLWAIVAALRGREALAAGGWRAVWLGATAGVLAGLAYLVRPEFLLTAALAILALLAVRSLSGRSRRVQLAAVGATLAGAAVCVLPYALAIGGLTLKKSLSDIAAAGMGAGAFDGMGRRAAEGAEGKDLVERDRSFVSDPAFHCSSAAGGLPERVGVHASRTSFVPRQSLGTKLVRGTLALGSRPKPEPGALQRVLERLSQAMGPAGTAAAGVAIVTWVGLFVLRLTLPREVRIVPTGHGALLLLAPLAVTVPLFAALEANWGPRYVSTRHMLLCGALLAPAAGAGVMILAGWGRRLLSRVVARDRAGLIAAAAAVAAAILPTLPRAVSALHEGKAPHRLAGRLLAQIDGGGHFVAGPSSWVPFYALAPAEQFTEGTDMSPTLTDDDVRSPAALLGRLRRDDPRRQYRYIAMDRQLRAAAAEGATVDRLHDAGVLIPLATIGKEREQVDLFEVRMTRVPPRAPRTTVHGRPAPPHSTGSYPPLQNG